MLALQHASLEDHLRIAFELLDTRGDGSVTREAVEEILKVCRLCCLISPTSHHSPISSLHMRVCRTH